jgi:hypothetical protein
MYRTFYYDGSAAKPDWYFGSVEDPRHAHGPFATEADAETALDCTRERFSDRFGTAAPAKPS